MRDFFLVLVKGVLWLLIVLLLRPLNYVLDWSISSYVKLREQCTDNKPSKTLIISLSVVTVLIVVVLLIIKIYG